MRPDLRDSRWSGWRPGALPFPREHYPTYGGAGRPPLIFTISVTSPSGVPLVVLATPLIPVAELRVSLPTDEAAFVSDASVTIVHRLIRCKHLKTHDRLGQPYGRRWIPYAPSGESDDCFLM